MRSVIYVRQSLDATGQALAVERQLEECQRLAASRGLTVVEVIRENNTSATYGKRPGYIRVLDLIKSGSIQAVVVWKMDRLLRRLTDLEELIDLCEQHGAQVITASGDVDLTNSAGRLIGRILASVARSEMETKSERHRLANSQRAKSGLPHKGRRAFGYDLDGVTLIESEALALKEVGHRFLNGYTYQQLADWLNDNGYMTAMGNKFYGVAIRQMLQRDRYRGVRTHNGTEFPAAWPAIFDEDTWTLIQHTIRHRSEAAGNRPAYRRHLLTGLLFCGRCGAAMNGTRTRDRRTGEPRRVYRCNRQRGGCGKVTRASVALEWWLRELVCYRLDSDELGQMLGKDHIADVRKKVGKRAVLEARLEALLDDYADGTLTKPEYKRAKERAQSALEAVSREIDAMHQEQSLAGLVGAGEVIRRRWDIEATGWRRNLLDLLIERVVIHPSKQLPRVKIDGRVHHFDREAVEVVWRV